MKSGISVIRVLAGISLMFALAALVTIGAFLTFVAPDERGKPFYLWLAVVCTAEFVAFAWAADTAIARQAANRLSGAVRVTIHVMIAIWLLATIAAAIFAAGPGRIQNYYNDRLAALYAVLTFLFFFAAFQLYRRDLTAQAEDAVTQIDRSELRKYVGAIDAARDRLRQMAATSAGAGPRIDRIHKRLDALRTSLDYAPPGKLGTVEEQGGVHVDQVNADIIAEVGNLSATIEGLGTPPADQILAEIEAAADRIESLLRERQRQLIT